MNTIQVTKIGARFVAHSTFEQRAIPKAAGFRWDGAGRVWYTTDPVIAARMMDPEAAAKVVQQAEEKQAQKVASIEQSRSAGADIDLPCPDGLAYLPYQRAGIAYALARNSVLFGDEMGLGKTVQAIGVINADTSLKKVLVVCPASLKLNWQREMEKWLCRPMTIGLADGKVCAPSKFDVTIINYDNLAKHSETLRGVAWDILIADEMHYCKNGEAKRTRALVGSDRKGKEAPGIQARRRIGLTGTPIPNRPIEGFPIFHYLAPEEFRNIFGYAKRYCAAFENGYGWDFSGSGNLGELQDKLRASIMVRRLKKDVLTELPAKRRAIIEISANGSSAVVDRERLAWDKKEETITALRAAVELAKASDSPDDYATAVGNLKGATSAAFAELEKLRHDTAVAKVPYVIEHLRNAIEDGGKVVVFGHHHDVIDALAAEFGNESVTVNGDVAIAARQAAVDRFQTDETCKVFIGGIQAAGVGLTLTQASHVVFAELDWVPGNMTQAEDRCHRIGQTDMVLVEHLVLEGSLDARMAHILVEKQKVIDEALDKEPVAMAPVVPVAKKEKAATDSATRVSLEKEAITITVEQSAAIHSCLRMLSGVCDGAREIDGCGFNKIDSHIGKSLAMQSGLSPKQAALGRKIVSKYHRQLPEETLKIAKG